MSEALVLSGIVVAAASGVPGPLFGRLSRGGQWLSIVLAVLAGALGLVGIGVFWFGGDSEPVVRPWSLFTDVPFSVMVDGLSAVFLAPIFLIFPLASVYGLGYWRQTDHPENGRKLRLFYGTLTAGMALLVIARNSIVFLFGWEVMALSAFFLVTTEDRERDVREAGFLYLATTHIATLCLFGLFALLRAASGSFELAPMNLTPEAATAVFLLAIVGFGLKAGMMPLHVWLLSAHAAAPSHVSAMMSGVLIKMGIYGLVRVLSLLPVPPVEWGGIVLGFGVVSGVLGIAFALGQRDLKRLLAYSSIENIGIILIGIGLALMGRSLRRPDWVVLGLGGSLLHVWNHSLFKSLLFFCAGSVIHATDTRAIDRLGGLAKGMRGTALCFLIGAVAVCALPPLNGFVSELLLYLGLFRTLDHGTGGSFPAAAFAAPALAMIGALAAACFANVFGTVFLGTARTEHARNAHEAGPAMLGPMGVLVGCCFVFGLAPVLIAPLIAKGVSAWMPDLNADEPGLLELAPLGWITPVGLGLLASFAAVGTVLRWRMRTGVAARGTTWSCGYVAPTPRMQYTASSFAQMLVSLFRWALRPRLTQPRELSLFPEASRCRVEVPDPVLDEAVLPVFRLGGWLLSSLRVFQRGNVQTYLLYIFVALIVLLLWR